MGKRAKGNSVSDDYIGSPLTGRIKLKMERNSVSSDKYLRLVYCLVETCSKSTRRLLLFYLEKSRPADFNGREWTIDDFLYVNRERLPKLNPSQHMILFPGRNINTDTERWDISLLFIVLEMFNLDSVITKDSLAIKKTRNRIFHAASTSIVDSKYEEYKEKISVYVQNCCTILDDQTLASEIENIFKEADGTKMNKETQIRVMSDFDNWFKSEQLFDCNDRIPTEIGSIMDALFENIVNLLGRFRYEIPDAYLSLQISSCSLAKSEEISKQILQFMSENISPQENESRLGKAISTAKSALIDKHRKLVEIRQGCLILRIRSEDFEDFWCLILDCISGKLTSSWSDVQNIVREEHDAPYLTIGVGVTASEIISCVEELVQNISGGISNKIQMSLSTEHSIFEVATVDDTDRARLCRSCGARTEYDDFTRGYSRESKEASKGHIEKANMDDIVEPSSMSDEHENLCVFCMEQGENVKATMYCTQCVDRLCDSCTVIHQAQKFSKGHNVVEIANMPTEELNTEECEPCAEMNKHIPASAFCKECEEKLCKDCSDVHKYQKMTKLHQLLPITEYLASLSERKQFKCEPCLMRDIEVNATVHCNECEENLCMDCEKRHTSQKLTRNHNLVDISKQADRGTFEDGNDRKCELCDQIGEKNSASHLCRDCKEYLCDKCARAHTIQKATNLHKLINVDSLPKIYCGPCKEDGFQKIAMQMCVTCTENLCISCTRLHKIQKATKNHEVQDIQLPDIKDCDPCSESGTIAVAVKFCKECQESYCEVCGQLHTRQKATKMHVLVDQSLAEIREVFNERETTAEEEKPDVVFQAPTNKQDTNGLRPGKPLVSDTRSDSVTLTWAVPRDVDFGQALYQIRLKESDQKQWHFYPENPDRAYVTIAGLKTEGSYVFQVRALSEGEEGPYGPQSDEVKTSSSLASKLLPHTTKVREGNPSVHKILSTEIKAARNEPAKTRKFELGSPPICKTKEKTILLVGATGSGKSTLVDGIINYVAGVNWNDPFRFTLVDLEQDEKGKTQALSQTEWITCYTINPAEGSRLDYKLTIIDTPGFGDTRGLDRDNEIVAQLRELFSSKGTKGVVFIDAVCFLAKAPDARLTATQKYIFMSILSLFGQNIEENICTLITFADGKTPPVLEAIKKAKLPTKASYVFNNSGLFAENTDDKSSLAPMFWKMGIESFKKFFTSLDTLSTKSLQQTQNVLQQRQRLELTIAKLQPQVDAGLNKVAELKQEIDILKKHEREISDNQDFEYEVDETKQEKQPLPVGRHVTNCLTCNISCHFPCGIPKDEDKKGCWAMDDNGYCRICDGKCFWQMHHNTPYVFSYITVKVKKTYCEKKKMYQKAGAEKITHAQVVQRMKEELKNLLDSIEDMMEDVNECNTILKNIALHPNPLTMVEHIDLMIESEKMEKKYGFQKRINVLQGYRKRAEIHKDVDKLQKDSHSVVGGGARPAREKKQGAWGQFKHLFGM